MSFAHIVNPALIPSAENPYLSRHPSIVVLPSKLNADPSEAFMPSCTRLSNLVMAGCA